MNVLTFGLYFNVMMLLVDASPDANRLFEDLMNSYNKWVRPVKNATAPIKIEFKFKLVQILDVHEKDQVLTTSGWLTHIWRDYRLTWDPEQYDNVTVIHIPAPMLWLPDIILYNNADGSPQVTQQTKAHVYHTGYIHWEPPVLYNSVCAMNMKYFPYDEQCCEMKFGSWTYYSTQLDMNYLENDVVNVIAGKENETIWAVDVGIDISEYQESVEWDLLAIPAHKHNKAYTCCPNQSVDITYFMDMRRKTLFYTVNLIVPCCGITGLTCLVFYLPSESHNKITLSVSILVSLTVFFLLLVEIIPPTSVTTPLIGKFLLFTMVLVSLSVCATVVVINVHHRSGTMQPMPAWVRAVFIRFLPRILFIKRPKSNIDPEYELLNIRRKIDQLKTSKMTFRNEAVTNDNDLEDVLDASSCNSICKNIKKIEKYLPINQLKERMYRNICCIAEHFKVHEFEESLSQDWKYVAVVLDRILLLLFSITIVIGSFMIFTSAPVFQDNRKPITEILKDQYLSRRISLAARLAPVEDDEE